VEIILPVSIRRLAQFLKSVWPADRAFVALLVGSILLLMAQHLATWTLWMRALYRQSGNSISLLAHVSSLLNLSTFPVYFAGAAALFICFFPGERPSARLAKWVYVPTAIGLTANLLIVSYLRKMYPSVPIPDGHPLTLTLSGFATLVHGVGAGIWSAIIGTFLILYGDLRLRSANLHLPVHLKLPYSARPNSDSDRSLNRFIWMMITLPLLASLSTFPAIYSPALLRGALGYGWNLEWRSPFWGINYINLKVWHALTLFVLVYVAMGSSRRETLKRSLRLPSAAYLGVGILFPAILFAVLPLAHYLFDRIHWAAYDFQRFGPPLFQRYFTLPPWPYLFLIPAALVEEIAWRGYLQPRFILRYGLYRGIFLVGIVWGIFHFPFDVSSRMTLTQILIYSVTRLLNCVSWGFALSWLTLRSRSVLPAALVHGFMNILIISTWIGTSVWVFIFLWTVIDIVLFRYWPPDPHVDSALELVPDGPPQHPQQLLDTPS
jgi:membrane protease YdiL (CAAX protease family)